MINRLPRHVPTPKALHMPRNDGLFKDCAARSDSLRGADRSTERRSE
jgi:hypothetical protein